MKPATLFPFNGNFFVQRRILPLEYFIHNPLFEKLVAERRSYHYNRSVPEKKNHTFFNKHDFYRQLICTAGFIW